MNVNTRKVSPQSPPVVFKLFCIDESMVTRDYDLARNIQYEQHKPKLPAHLPLVHAQLMYQNTGL